MKNSKFARFLSLALVAATAAIAAFTLASCEDSDKIVSDVETVETMNEEQPKVEENEIVNIDVSSADLDVVPDKTSNNEDVQKNASSYEDYKSFLSTLDTSYSNQDVTYALFDIDSNGIQEIIANTDIWEHTVYTYTDNGFVNTGSFFSKYGLSSLEGILLASSGGTGYLEYMEITLGDEFTIYQNETPFLVLEYFMPEDMTSDPVTEYHYKGESITEQEYDAIQDKINLIEEVPVTDISLLDILK